MPNVVLQRCSALLLAHVSAQIALLLQALLHATVYMHTALHLAAICNASGTTATSTAEAVVEPDDGGDGWKFNIVMVLVAMFFGMMLTNWGVVQVCICMYSTLQQHLITATVGAEWSGGWQVAFSLLSTAC
jgi:hypothetical protein